MAICLWPFSIVHWLLAMLYLWLLAIVYWLLAMLYPPASAVLPLRSRHHTRHVRVGFTPKQVFWNIGWCGLRIGLRTYIASQRAMAIFPDAHSRSVTHSIARAFRVWNFH